MVEQVVAQQFGKQRGQRPGVLRGELPRRRPRPRASAEGGGALGERVRAAVTVISLADPVGVEQHAVTRARPEQVGVRRGAAHVEQAERRRRRQRVKRRDAAVPQQQRRRVPAADDLRVGLAAVRYRDELSGDELLAVRVVGHERVQPGRDDLQRVRLRGEPAEGPGDLGGGPRGARVMPHHVADEQADSVRGGDGAGDVTAGRVAAGVAAVRRHRAGGP